MNDINTLILTVRDILGRIKVIENAGHMVQVEEVGPNSFVQLMAAMPLVPGMLEPVGWQYNQFWLDKSTEEVRVALVGAYLNEWVGQSKIIGIYEQV